MRLRLDARDVPGRLVAGAYIAHAGLAKWHGSAQQAEALHGMAAAAFPFLRPVPPRRFLRMLAAGEIATGALLLAPVVPNAVAGSALTGFSGSLLAMYLRAPTMHKPGSIWPTPAGIAVSKDVWLLGIGLGLLAQVLTRGERAASVDQTPPAPA